MIDKAKTLEKTPVGQYWPVSAPRDQRFVTQRPFLFQHNRQNRSPSTKTYFISSHLASYHPATAAPGGSLGTVDQTIRTRNDLELGPRLPLRPNVVRFDVGNDAGFQIHQAELDEELDGMNALFYPRSQLARPISTSMR